MSVASRVVELFEMRGWGLYRTSNEIVMDMEYLKEVIGQGREKNAVEIGIYYLVLPLVENDSSFDDVSEAICTLTEFNRFPIYVSVIKVGEDKYASNGVFFLSAVRLWEDRLELLVDFDAQRKAGLYVDPMFDGSDTYSLFLSFDEVESIGTQVIKAWRKKRIIIPRTKEEMEAAMIAVKAVEERLKRLQ